MKAAGKMPALAYYAFAWLSLISCGGGNAPLEATGTLEAVEIRVPARGAGVALDVPVREGERVEAGDVLVILDDASLRHQRDQAAAARDIAEAGLDLVLEGARREDLDSARQALKSAEENLRIASEEADRLRALMGTGSVSQQQMDRAESAEVLARGARSQAASALAKLESGAREPEVVQARAALEQAEAVLALAQESLADARIVSPIGGTVIYRMMEKGEWASPGSTVFVIADLENLRLTVYVPEPRLAEIMLGQEAEVTMDGDAETVIGRVTWISPEAEFTPKNVQTDEERAKQVFAVRIDVENPDGVLKPGMPADVVFRSAGDE